MTYLPHRDFGGTLRTVVLFCGWISVLLISRTRGQEIPLYLEQRYDELLLSAEFDNARIQIFPLPFGPENIPNATDEPLRVRLVDYPDREYDVAWKDIAKIDFFEDALIAEAIGLMKAGRLEEAYDELRFVWKSTPDWRGLKAAIDDFLLADSVAAYREGRDEEAMVILEELFRRKPDPKYANAVAHVVDRAFSKRLSEKDYDTARQLIRWVSSRPQLNQQDRVVVWRKGLRDLADQHLEAARTAAADRRYRDAMAAIDKSIYVLPDDTAARQLANRILADYPRVTVAVSRFANPGNGTVDLAGDWAVERTSRLVNRHLLELVEYGADGGRFRSGYGPIKLETGGLGMTLAIPEADDANLVRDTVRDTLMQASSIHNPNANRYLTRLLDSIDTQADGIHVGAAKNTLRWLPLLDVPLDSTLDRWQPFRSENTDNESRRHSFLANDQYELRRDHQILEIVERLYTRQSDMVDAIESEDVDVVARLLPAEADQIKDRNVIVGRYGLISMYFLVPNDRSKLAVNRAFRRGIVYALPRENILNQLLLYGRSYDGCKVLSGPFHMGFDRSDPMAYAYDPQVKPRAFDPSLGATLIAMSWHLAELDEQEAKSAAPATEVSSAVDQPTLDKSDVVETHSESSDVDQQIVIVHADDAILASLADLICRSLRTAGVRCKTQRLTAGATRPPDDDSWHLWLVDVVAQEPIIDIFQMYGPRGLVTKPSAYIQQALNELTEVTRWSDARTILNQIHELVHGELSMIPLWQLTNHFAYRRGLEGLNDGVMTLYQDVDQWSIKRSTGQ